MVQQTSANTIIMLLLQHTQPSIPLCERLPQGIRSHDIKGGGGSGQSLVPRSVQRHDRRAGPVQRRGARGGRRQLPRHQGVESCAQVQMKVCRKHVALGTKLQYTQLAQPHRYTRIDDS